MRGSHEKETHLAQPNRSLTRPEGVLDPGPRPSAKGSRPSPSGARFRGVGTRVQVGLGLLHGWQRDEPDRVTSLGGKQETRSGPCVGQTIQVLLGLWIIDLIRQLFA